MKVLSRITRVILLVNWMSYSMSYLHEDERISRWHDLSTCNIRLPIISFLIIVFTNMQNFIQKLDRFVLGPKPEMNITPKIKRLNLKEDELLKVATRYFYLGFALLPWIWLINYLYLAPITRDFPNLSKDIKQCNILF